ncbi:aminotransferase class I/II-fold pyridoxal phosphate-dependent enzyme [Methylotuvimicrobium sp.]|uniref:aminotransferase class I/II-fold pyridoxal phosphate-dependent enzyme n=1 Tax=Methylotuvimicrobium sp. TaxID=2822413 RepID=UPI003D655BEF
MKHGGNIYNFAERIGCRPDQVLDFSANINPVQAIEWRALQFDPSPYADPDYSTLKQALRHRYPLPASADLEPFNGASAAIFALLRMLHPEEIVLYTPMYVEYARIARQLDCRIRCIDRFEHFKQTEIPPYSTVIFVNPATPDGALYDLQELLAQWRAARCTILIDESFLDFCPAAATASIAYRIDQIPNLYLIKSLSKFYGSAGVRIGFVAAERTAITNLKQLEPAWKLSSFDIAYMQQALYNDAFADNTRKQTTQLRESLRQVLEDSNLFDRVHPSQANFILARLAKIDGQALQRHLEKARILIRVCDNFEGLDKRHVRFAVKDAESIARLAECLQHV